MKVITGKKYKALVDIFVTDSVCAVNPGDILIVDSVHIPLYDSNLDVNQVLVDLLTPERPESDSPYIQIPLQSFESLFESDED